MKASEFRLNNYVKDKQGGYSQISSISHNCAFEPIELTEEWLLRFGFNKEKNKREFFNNDVFIKPFPAWNIWLCVYWFERLEMGDLEQHFNSYIHTKWHNKDEYEELHYSSIDYVHQLQNLYFALTGEELEIQEIE